VSQQFLRSANVSTSCQYKAKVAFPQKKEDDEPCAGMIVVSIVALSVENQLHFISR